MGAAWLARWIAWNVPIATPNAPGGADSTAANDRARDLLRRAVEAKGGLATLKSIRTVVADAETTFLLDQGSVPATTRTYVVYPDKFRVDATMGDGAQVAALRIVQPPG